MDKIHGNEPRKTKKEAILLKICGVSRISRTRRTTWKEMHEDAKSVKSVSLSNATCSDEAFDSARERKRRKLKGNGPEGRT